MLPAQVVLLVAQEVLLEVLLALGLLAPQDPQHQPFFSRASVQIYNAYLIFNFSVSIKTCPKFFFAVFGTFGVCLHFGTLFPVSNANFFTVFVIGLLVS